MKILTVCVLSALALVFGASANAADNSNNVVSQDYTDTVTPAHQAAYEDGVKAWNQCLREHGSRYAWNAYVHVTGDVYKYSYVTGPHSWEDFDAMRKTNESCDATWREKSNPYLQGESSTFMIDQPDLSYLPATWRNDPQPALIDVIYFTLKRGHEANEAFTSALKKIAAAAVKTKSTVYFRTLSIQAGDDGAPDYILVLPSKDWADYGKLVNSSPWPMVEKAYGKTEADALRKSLNDAIDKTSEHIDRYNAELTYSAGK